MNLLRVFCVQHLNRSFTFNAGRLVLAFLDVPCRAHTEQCSLAEFSSHVIRDVIMHIDLAAEERCKPKRQRALVIINSLEVRLIAWWPKTILLESRAG